MTCHPTRKGDVGVENSSNIIYVLDTVQSEAPSGISAPVLATPSGSQCANFAPYMETLDGD